MDSQAIWCVLERVPDPEIPVLSIVDLGIVRDVRDGTVIVTPTYSGCPATLAIEQAIRAELDSAGFRHIGIETVIAPPWTSKWITPEGHDKLRRYGIAPPSTSPTAECPRCGSIDTREVSRFGSTPCKAQWQCKQCLEPFDRFKCH